MNYTPEQFFKLAKMIEAEGGEHLDSICASKRYEEFSGPVRPSKPVTLAGCGNSTIFELPYPAEAGGLEPIKLCAVCDDIGGIPRFQAAMR